MKALEMELLRDVEEADLAIFFEHQLDPDSHEMAAFLPRDRVAFMSHWDTILSDEAVFKKTIVLRERVAGYVVSFEQSGRRLVGYWVGREFWGKGLATRALLDFLTQIDERPLYAYVAKTNGASIRVLEKSGFVRSGERAAPVHPDGTIVEDFVYLLSGSSPGD